MVGLPSHNLMPDPKKHLAGREPESAPVFNALNQLGKCCSDLCTEAMLFGLGGGLGFAYFLFDLHGYHPMFFGTRYHASESETPVFMMQMCDAWGATAELKHSSSRGAATKQLTKALEDGYTPIVWVNVINLSPPLASHFIKLAEKMFRKWVGIRVANGQELDLLREVS